MEKGYQFGEDGLEAEGKDGEGVLVKGMVSLATTKGQAGPGKCSYLTPMGQFIHWECRGWAGAVRKARLLRGKRRSRCLSFPSETENKVS